MPEARAAGRALSLERATPGGDRADQDAPAVMPFESESPEVKNDVAIVAVEEPVECENERDGLQGQ